jgi:hypothetical protein
MTNAELVRLIRACDRLDVEAVRTGCWLRYARAKARLDALAAMEEAA